MNRDHRIQSLAARSQPELRLKLRFKVLLGLLAAATLLCAMPKADAESASATFQATASVVKACTLSTPGTLGYGAYDPNANTPLAATTNFNVMCTSGTAYSIGLNAGTGAGATVTNRVMTSSSAAPGTNTLSYSLYKDPARTISWDNSTSATGYSATGASQGITLYGQIPSGQYRAAPASDYSDTLTMTLSY